MPLGIQQRYSDTRLRVKSDEIRVRGESLLRGGSQKAGFAQGNLRRGATHQRIFEATIRLTVRECGERLDSLGLPPEKLADINAIRSERMSQMLHHRLEEIEPDRGRHLSGNLQNSSASSGLFLAYLSYRCGVICHCTVSEHDHQVTLDHSTVGTTFSISTQQPSA